MTRWPHSPLHRFPESGAYIVTAATLYKQHHFRSSADLDQLTTQLFEKATQYGWQLQAWAVFSNHYHFVALSPEDPTNLPRMLAHLHGDTSREANRRDGVTGRKVWFNYWDTHLTYQKSYFARLNYVHGNPVHHGLAAKAEAYRWCSASWFGEHAERSFVHTIRSFKTDSVRVFDEFEPVVMER
jgi:putative transposase